MLTTTAAAALLNLAPDTIKRHCQRGVIKAEKFGRDWLITQAEVDRYATARHAPGRPAKEEIMQTYERTAEYQTLKAAYDAATEQLAAEGHYLIPARQPTAETWQAYVKASAELDAYVKAHETRSVRELMLRSAYEAGDVE